ncbi:hypothetical protein [Sphingobium sp.]|uniref:hypothetical protein n=1 Tax=Sphingobium sp. TaxID=1912891 RepID=UPI00257A80D4|nr:hypothetical protein [Sphingobium sp.]
MDRVHRMSRLPVIVALFAMGIAWSGLELFGETEQFCITLITLLLAVIWYGTRELARGMRDIEDFITLISAEGISFCGALSILVSGPTRYGPSISAFAIIGLGLLVAGCTWGLWNEVSRYITRQVKRR